MCFSLNLLQHLTLLVSEVTTFRGEGGGAFTFIHLPCMVRDPCKGYEIYNAAPLTCRQHVFYKVIMTPVF